MELDRAGSVSCPMGTLVLAVLNLQVSLLVLIMKAVEYDLKQGLLIKIQSTPVITTSVYATPRL